jgi:hypothetical protein
MFTGTAELETSTVAALAARTNGHSIAGALGSLHGIDPFLGLNFGQFNRLVVNADDAAGRDLSDGKERITCGEADGSGLAPLEGGNLIALIDEKFGHMMCKQVTLFVFPITDYNTHDRLL